MESDPDARATLELNRPDWPLADPGDALQLAPEDALAQAGLAQGELTLLAGGPPCQPFSKSGYWATGDARRLEDPRAKTLARFFDFVDAALPSVLLLENVRGLAFNGKSEGLDLLQRRLDQTNAEQGTAYAATVIALNCADFGVPQNRERVFVIAASDGAVLVPPAPTHHSVDALLPGQDRQRTTWDAIGDLDQDEWPTELNPTGKWAALLPSIPEGENYQWHTARSGGEPLFGWRTRYWSFLLKLAKDRPSWTIQASPGPATGPFHWRSRRLSPRELCRLQTFPDDYEITGDHRRQHRQIGNAVPPAIGALLGAEIRNQLLNHNVEVGPVFVPPARGDCPPPEPVVPVAPEYHQRRGEHLEHPGTGLGPGATRRAGAEAGG